MPLFLSLFSQSYPLIFFPKGFCACTIVGSSVISAKVGGIADDTELDLPDPVVISFALKRNVMLIIIIIIIIVS